MLPVFLAALRRLGRCLDAFGPDAEVFRVPRLPASCSAVNVRSFVFSAMLQVRMPVDHRTRAPANVGEQLAFLRERLRLLEDKEAIRDVLFRNARGVDRADGELLKSTYHPDAREIHWRSFTGNAHAFSDFITVEMARIESVSHTITNPLIEIEGDRAFSECQYTARNRINRDEDLGGWVEQLVWGRYLDILERRDGTWRISLRRLAKDGNRLHLVTEASPMEIFKQPLEGSEGRPGRDDPSYLRFDLAEDINHDIGGEPDIFGSHRRFRSDLQVS